MLLDAFNMCILCLSFVRLISMCLSMFLLGFIMLGTLCASWTWIDYFLSHVEEIFDYNLFKDFLRLFLFLFFFWYPYNLNVGAFNIVPDLSEILVISFHSFSFILLFSSYFQCSIFQLTYSFFGLSYSAIDSF